MSTQTAPASDVPASGARPTAHARPLLLTGAAGALVFVANVVFGGLITPGYSHLRHAVSELTQAGAANALPLGALFVLSALLMGLFGVAVALEYRGRSRRVHAGGILILLYAVQAVLLATIFPQDPIGAPLTFPGTMHLVLVGISALCIVAAILLVAYGLDPVNPRWRHFRLYSLVCIGVMLAGGLATPLLVAADIALLGLSERLTQLAYLLWFTLFSLWAYAESARPTSAPA